MCWIASLFLLQTLKGQATQAIPTTSRRMLSLKKCHGVRESVYLFVEFKIRNSAVLNCAFNILKELKDFCKSSYKYEDGLGCKNDIRFPLFYEAQPREVACETRKGGKYIQIYVS